MGKRIVDKSRPGKPARGGYGDSGAALFKSSWLGRRRSVHEPRLEAIDNPAVKEAIDNPAVKDAIDELLRVIEAELVIESRRDDGDFDRHPGPLFRARHAFQHVLQMAWGHGLKAASVLSRAGVLNVKSYRKCFGDSIARRNSFMKALHTFCYVAAANV